MGEGGVKSIALIGFRGVGKTTVAVALAQRLGWPLISTDELVRERLGPISDSVAADGWGPFHEAEAAIVFGLDVERTVIDCGGGLVRNPEAVSHLRRSSHLVYLSALAEEIVGRLERSHPRPPIGAATSVRAEVAEVLPRRLEAYGAAATLEIDTTHLSAIEVAAAIIESLASEPALDEGRV